MSTAYEPMQEVRKNFRVSWYRSPIDRENLRELTQRSDLKGLFQTLGHVALVVASGFATDWFFDREIWVGFALALFAHGSMFSFLGGYACHELAHGTVFKTKWLNGFFLRILSLISWFNFHDYRMSHTYHHLYTLHPRGDREVVLPTSPTLHIFYLIQLFTLNVVGARNEPYGMPIVRFVGATVRLALTGKHSKGWLRDVFKGQDAARRKAANWARLLLLFNAVIIAAGVVFKLWMLPVLITLAPFIANWGRYFVGAPMHTGLRDNVSDFRLCVRTITLDPFTSFLYWRMNWHTEHHMFAAVPCYNLKKLHDAVADDMPKPRTLLQAWKEMRQTRNRQITDPNYQFDTPLPGDTSDSDTGATDGSRRPDEMEASIGDLAPDELE